MSSVYSILAVAATSVTQSDRPFGERMLIGLEVTLIGLLTVFAALIVIWGILELSRKVFAGSKDESKARTPEKEQPAEAVPTPSFTDDAALVAAITAAVAAYTGKSDSSLRVVRFTRK